jgi:hypothetical protein
MPFPAHLFSLSRSPLERLSHRAATTTTDLSKVRPLQALVLFLPAPVLRPLQNVDQCHDRQVVFMVLHKNLLDVSSGGSTGTSTALSSLYIKTLAVYGAHSRHSIHAHN